jgi:ERCC4-related helicase
MSLELPAYQVRLLSGNDGVEHWSNQSIWDGVLRNINIVVCTHQVLLDALTHAFVQMTNIALLIFDEAHHCVKNHAANKIMKHFYHPMRQETPQEVPGVLGLTASPVVGKKPEGLKYAIKCALHP